MSKEIRHIDVDSIEIRSEENEQRLVEGVAIVYDREVEIWPGFFERIRPGAFEKSVRNGDEIKSYYNHNPSMVLATTKSKPALLIDDQVDALRFKAPIPPTTYGNDLKVNLERKNVRGASFSFTVAKDGDILTRDEKGKIHREITKGALYEVGPVTNPAYAQTKVGLRDAESVYQDIVARMTVTESNEEIQRNQAALDLMKNIITIKLWEVL
jgi:HK97 family phage prohead protease